MAILFKMETLEGYCSYFKMWPLEQEKRVLLPTVLRQ